MIILVHGNRTIHTMFYDVPSNYIVKLATCDSNLTTSATKVNSSHLTPLQQTIRELIRGKRCTRSQIQSQRMPYRVPNRKNSRNKSLVVHRMMHRCQSFHVQWQRRPIQPEAGHQLTKLVTAWYQLPVLILQWLSCV